jgi:hypothetical protein
MMKRILFDRLQSIITCKINLRIFFENNQQREIDKTVRIDFQNNNKMSLVDSI